MITQFYSRLLVLCLFTSLSGAVSLYAQSTPDRALDQRKVLTQFVHEVWETDDGLPQGSINAIAQTDDGYLWLGTQEGLVRFDGLGFVEFNTSNEDAFLGNDVRNLLKDSRGTLWIGTRGGGIIRYKNNRFDRFAEDDSLANNTWVNTLVESREGHLWVGTDKDGLYKLRNGHLERVNEISSDLISALYEDEFGNLWVGTRDMGLLWLYDDKIVPFSTENGLADNFISAVIGSKGGGIWVGTNEGGLARIENEQVSNYTSRHGLAANRIYSLYEDAKGSLWIGTQKGGLTRLILPGSESNPNQIHISTFDQDDGLSYNDVKTIFQDREANLWLGTDGGGLNLLRESKFTTYTVREGLVDDFIYAVHQDDSGAMWFSSENGVSRLYDGQFSVYTESHGLSRNFVISLASTPDGSVWMGTYGGGLSRLKNGEFQNYTHLNGLPDDGVFALFTDSKDDLWVGTGGGMARFSRDRFITYNKDSGLNSNDVTVFAEDGEGAMWVGTFDDGLNRLVNQTFYSLTAKDGLSNNTILGLYYDDEGVFWIATGGGGLNRIEDGNLSVITTKDGLFNDRISTILEDSEGNLWMSCNKGVFRVSKKELNEFAEGTIDRVHSVVYDKTDGLKSAEFNGGYQPSGWKDNEGRLWFPSTKGVALIDPDNIPVNDMPPGIVLQDIVVDREHQTLSSERVEFQPGRDKIEFHYAGLSFVAPEKVRYRYQLEGEDEEWVEAGSRREAFYNNLDPGLYTFRVMAQNSDGYWSEEAASFQFYLKPFFYETTWFYIISSLALLLGIFGVHRWRVAQLKANERELERVVEIRTRDLEKRTGDLLEALEENKEILGITSHDLKNPLGGIIGLADILIDDLAGFSKVPVVKEGLENIELVKHEAERMLRIVKELLDKHRAGEQTIVEKKHEDLTVLIEDALRWNAQKAEEKNISLNFEPKDPIQVHIDADAMLRVADNLISNAIKYSPPGSDVMIVLKSEKGEAVFEVRDQGPGLTQDDLTKVFGRMQRLSAKPTGGEHSTGLGLYIVKQLVEQHDGSVGVNSVYGHGSCFWFKLPIVISTPPPSDRKKRLVSLG